MNPAYLTALLSSGRQKDLPGQQIEFRISCFEFRESLQSLNDPITLSINIWGEGNIQTIDEQLLASERMNGLVIGLRSINHASL
jgi:hypothetical protein